MKRCRFDYNDPQNPYYPGIIDWHIYDDGERISVGKLVREANRLQRELNELKQQQAQPLTAAA